jgi:hypothetical protein
MGAAPKNSKRRSLLPIDVDSHVLEAMACDPHEQYVPLCIKSYVLSA